jgi:hypothetical protein
VGFDFGARSCGKNCVAGNHDGPVIVDVAGGIHGHDCAGDYRIGGMSCVLRVDRYLEETEEETEKNDFCFHFEFRLIEDSLLDRRRFILQRAGAAG